MKKKLLSFLAVGALLAQSSGVYARQSTKKVIEGAQKVAATHREAAMMRGIRSPEAAKKWEQSPEFSKKVIYNYEVMLPKILEKFNVQGEDKVFIETIFRGPEDMLVMLTGAARPELTKQFVQAAKEAAKHSVWPELAQKVVAHFVARMEGNKQKIAQAYKEANNLFYEMNGLMHLIEK